MISGALRASLALGIFAGITAQASVARADRFLAAPVDVENPIDRPLTLPQGTFTVSTGGFARHYETGVVFSGSGAGAGYGITDRLDVSVSAINAEYTPDTRISPPGAAVTYAFFDSVVQAGLRLRIGGVLTPSPGITLSPSLPIRIPIGSRFRLDLGPQMLFVVTGEPAVGVIAPFTFTAAVGKSLFMAFDTAAEVFDVRARTMIVPARLTAIYEGRIQDHTYSIAPFFSFPQLWTPGDEIPHFHKHDYAFGIGLGTWFRR